MAVFGGVLNNPPLLPFLRSLSKIAVDPFFRVFRKRKFRPKNVFFSLFLDIIGFRGFDRNLRFHAVFDDFPENPKKRHFFWFPGVSATPPLFFTFFHFFWVSGSTPGNLEIPGNSVHRMTQTLIRISTDRYDFFRNSGSDQKVDVGRSSDVTKKLGFLVSLILSCHAMPHGWCKFRKFLSMFNFDDGGFSDPDTTFHGIWIFLPPATWKIHSPPRFPSHGFIQISCSDHEFLLKLAIYTIY